MRTQTSRGSIAQANLICSVWAIGGRNGERRTVRSLAERIAAEGACNKDELYIALNRQKTKDDISTSKWIEAVHDHLNRDIICKIAMESIGGAALDNVRNMIHAGLLRGASLDEEGFYLLQSVLAIAPNREGRIGDEDAESLSNAIADMLLETPEKNESRPENTFPPRANATSVNTRCGYAITHLGKDAERLSGPYAVAAALSALMDGSLGYESDTYDWIRKLPWSEDKKPARLQKLMREFRETESRKTTKDQTDKRYDSWGRELEGLLVDCCPLDEDEWSRLLPPATDRDICERVVDGFAAALYMPEDIVELMAGAYADGSWFSTRKVLLGRLSRMAKSWVTNSTRLTDDFRVKFEMLSLGNRTSDGSEVDQAVDGLVKGFGSSKPTRVALVGTRETQTRYIALLAAREMNRRGLYRDVFEVMAQDTLVDTLAGLSFEGVFADEGFESRTSRNGLRLEGLPEDSLTIISGVKYGKWSGSEVGKLSRVGSDVLVAIITTASEVQLPEGFIRIRLPQSPHDALERQSDIDKLPSESPLRTPEEISNLILCLLPNGSPADLVFATLGDNPAKRAVAEKVLQDGKLFVDESVRSRIQGIINRGAVPAEARAECCDSLDCCNKYLEKLSQIARDPKGNAEAAQSYFKGCLSAIQLSRGLVNLCDATGDPERAIPLLELQAGWLSDVGRTRQELEARRDLVKRKSKLHVSEGTILRERISAARLMARLGSYEEAIKELDNVLKESGALDDGFDSSFDPMDARRLAAVDAYIARGYVRHDWWEETWIAEGRLPWIAESAGGSYELLNEAIGDKKRALRLIERSVLRSDDIRRARVLSTLAYSYFYGRHRADAIRLIKAASKLFERAVDSNPGEVEIELEHAATINSWGFFLDDVGRIPEKSEEAFDLKHKALEIRRRLLPSDHMDFARSLNNCAISLKAMGRLEEAKKYVDEAAEIRDKRLGEPGEAGKTLIDWNRGEVESALQTRDRLNLLASARLRGFQGVMAVHATDLQGNVVSFLYRQNGRDVRLEDTTESQDEEVFESGSTIKVFIDAVLQKSIASGDVNPEEELTVTEADRVGGSGILKEAEVGSRFRLSDVATWMICISDNIATNMIIRRLDIRTINTCIRSMGFEHTRIHHALDFPHHHDFGQTTPKEYAKLLELIYRKRLFDGNIAICDTLLEHLGKQQNSRIIADGIPPYLLDSYDLEDGNIARTYSKSGLMNDVRADGGIVSSCFGTYIAVIMAKDFPEVLEDPADPCIVYGRRISGFLFDHFATINLEKRPR